MAAKAAPVSTVKHESLIRQDATANRNTNRGKETNNPESKKTIAHTEPGQLITVAAATSANNVPVVLNSDPVKNAVYAKVPRTENGIAQDTEIAEATLVQSPAQYTDISYPVMVLKTADAQKQVSANVQPEMVQRPDFGGVDPKKIQFWPGISFNICLLYTSRCV